jgi:FAD:protein FMN transferase
MACDQRALRRARPLLGTIVEIRVEGLEPAAAREAIERGFAAIARVERRMSPHDASSDLARLQAAGVSRAVRVSVWTWRVLHAARRFARMSNGVFDATIAPDAREPAGRWSAVELLPRARVRLRRATRLDLGGIAKGFAVDRAIAVLRGAGATAASVNAGGDLRVFGPSPMPVVVRHPASPGRLVTVGELANGAVATSANYLDGPGRGRLHRADGRRIAVGRASVSVIAPTCMAADALTKVVAALGPHRAASLLQRHAAQALVLRRDGRMVLAGPVALDGLDVQCGRNRRTAGARNVFAPARPAIRKTMGVGDGT